MCNKWHRSLHPLQLPYSYFQDFFWADIVLPYPAICCNGFWLHLPFSIHCEHATWSYSFFFFYLIILWKFWTSSHYILQLSGGRNPRYSVPIFAAITEHFGLSWINQMRPFPGENSSNLYLGNHNTCSTFFHYSFFCCIVCISASFTRMFTASQFIWISCGVPLFVPLLFPSALPLNFHFIRINRLSLLQCKTSLPSQCHFGHIWWLKHSVSFTETQNRLAGKIWIQIIIHNISLKRK